MNINEQRFKELRILLDNYYNEVVINGHLKEVYGKKLKESIDFFSPKKS